MQEHSKKIQELSNFLLDYATTLMAVGSHTSRIVKNVTRIAESFGFGVDMTIFQRNITMTVKHSEDYSIRRTYVRRIPAMALNFRTISDLSALSWDALDDRLPLDEIRRRYGELIDKPRIDPIFVLVTVGLANASFCRLFGGDWTAAGIVFTATLVGFAARQRMQAHGVNHFLIFIISAFMASLCASAALRFDCTAETALATSVLYLVPGVPLINGVIDIVEGHILIGFSRLINALLLIICIAIGLSATLLMVKNSLL